jgi:hypothetical protein
MSKNGLILLTPTSIAYTGTSATISANGSVSFSACSVLSLNDVFTSNYDNYRVIIGPVTATTSAGILYRLRVSGSDNSTASSYVDEQLVASGTDVTGSRYSRDSGYVARASSSSTPSGFIVDFYGPYLTQPTAWRSVSTEAFNSARIVDLAGTHNQSTAYDGFTLISNAGQNATGRVAVYGMRK